MSRASKLTLLGTSLFAAGTVTFVHWQQRSEKDVCPTHPLPASPSPFPPANASSPEPHTDIPLPNQAMHQGVIRDMEQQRVKRERQLDFDMQRELEAEYKKVQSVRESTGEAPLPPVAGEEGQGKGIPGAVAGTGIGAAGR